MPRHRFHLGLLCLTLLLGAVAGVMAPSAILGQTVSARSCLLGGGRPVMFYEYEGGVYFACVWNGGRVDLCSYGTSDCFTIEPGNAPPPEAAPPEEPEEPDEPDEPDTPEEPEQSSSSVAFNIEPIFPPEAPPPDEPPPPPPQEPPPPADQFRCLLCQFMRARNAQNQAVACSGLGDALYCAEQANDCYSYNGICKNRFLKRCEDEAAAWGGERAFIFDDTQWVDVSQCTSIDYIYDGHSNAGNVQQPFNVVQACVHAAPNLQQLNVLNDGCLTFRDVNAAMQHADRIRSTLPPGVTVKVTANQSPSDTGVTTYVSIDITADTLAVSLEGCHGPNDFCFGKRTENQTVICAAGGTVQEETCCPQSKWVRGRDCNQAACPNVGAICAGRNDGFTIGKTANCIDAGGAAVQVTCCRSTSASLAQVGLGEYRLGAGCY